MWYPLIIIAAGILAYANSFAAPFLFDDVTVVTNNPHIFHLWPPWKAVLFPTRCVADYTFALSHAGFGFLPAGYRLVNILIHLAAGLFLFGVIRQSLLLPKWGSRFAHSASSLAFAITLLWTVHPLQTESVTYIAQRYEALMGLFFLATLYCFIRGATRTQPGAWRASAVILCALGMGTKEIMIVAPIILFLYDGIFIASSWREAVRQRWRWHLALVSTLLIPLVLSVPLMNRSRAGNIALVEAGEIRWNYALTQLNILAHYLKLSVLPHPLCLDYRWPLVNSFREVLWPGTVTVLLACGTLWALWRRSWLGFTGAWFLVILAPTSSFLNPLPDAAFEHRMYLPLAAILTVGVMTLSSFFQETGRLRRELGTLLIVVVATSLGFLTHMRNTTYGSEEAMWRDVLRQRPDNYRTYVALSSALLDQERYPEAEQICSNLLAHLPPFSTMAGETILQRYVHQPGRPPILLYYSMAHNNLGQAAVHSGQREAAKEHYREALRVFPQGAWARRNLGQALYLEKDYKGAITELSKAIQWQPKDNEAHASLALALLEEKDYHAAVAHFEQALSLKPDHWFARAQLAWLLATCPADEIRNGARSLELALPLLKTTTEPSARALDIVAAAYAEAGDFQNAVEAIHRAINQSSKDTSRNGTAPDRAELQCKLSLYSMKQPYRE